MTLKSIAFAALATSLVAGASAQTLDNDQGSPVYTTAGSWFTSGSSGYNGGTYQYASTGYERTATWEVKLPHSGQYKIEVIYRAGGNRPTSAVYEIGSRNQSYTTTIDQTKNNLSWVSLGEYQLDYGSATITLNAQQSTPSGRAAIADAVRLTLINDPAEVRPAIVTVYEELDTVSGIQNLVDEIAALNYNAIMVHARYRGDATYFPNKTNSDYTNNEPRSFAAGNLDVLQEFIDRGGDAGLEVIAYVNCFLVTDGKDSDGRSAHIINQRPDWRTYAYNNGNPIVQTTAQDDEGLWLDPGLPEVRDYTADICADIVANYDVDGVVIDRIRYPQSSWRRSDKDFGYHPDSIAAFNAEYGKSGIPDPYDSDWIAYRTQQIDNAVESIYFHVTNVDPDVKLYAFPIGRYSDALNFNYVDANGWLEDGKIDGIFPMIYHDSNASFNADVDNYVNNHNSDRILGVAINGYRSGVNPDQKAAYARSRGMGGITFFTHDSMNDLGYNTTLTNTTFTSWAPTPAMPWKAQGSGTSAVRDNDSGQPVYLTSGSWFTSGSTGYNGGTYQYAFAGGNDFATWDLDVPQTGRWKVEVMYRAGSNRTTSTAYRIDAANGVESATINQRNNNLQWVSLGTYEFVKGISTVTLDASASTGGTVVISDAVRITKQ